MTDDPRRRYGFAPRVSATSEYAETSSATREPLARRVDERALEVLAAREGEGVDEDVERVVGLAPALEDARDVIVLRTSQGSTKVEPIDAASGRTRFSMRLSTDENPTSAPSAWRARAMPQAIEWSFATPKMSAVLPSSSPIVRSFAFPIRCHHARPPPRHGRPARRPPGRARPSSSMPTACCPQGRAAARGVECRSPRLEARGIPYRVVTNFSLAHRETLAARFAEGGLRRPGRPVHHRVLGRRGVHARRVHPADRSSSSPRPTRSASSTASAC